MQVTRFKRIYQVVETCQNKCFKQFTDEMVQGRREADFNTEKKAMGLVYKLLMKSGYVSILQNTASYKNVKYVKSECNALKLANEPLFSQLSELDSIDKFYEVQMHKRSHNHIIPTYLSFIYKEKSFGSILQYSIEIYQMGGLASNIF